VLNVFDEVLDLGPRTTDHETNHDAKALIRRLNMGDHVV
jgi:hypothetical protein